jgi:hypothetical protein
MSTTQPMVPILGTAPPPLPSEGVGIPLTSSIGMGTPVAAAGSTGSMIWFVLITLLNIGILVALFTVGNLEEVAKNWPRYRCNPIYMPFATSFGSDPVENFQFCLNSVFAGKAAAIFAPLYSILSEFGSIISKIVNVAMGLRNLFSNMFSSVKDFLGNVKQRILTILMQIRISFLKMNSLMGRVFGTLYAVIYMGISGLTAGQNIANNDLVKFLFEFCFAPTTPILLSNGSTILLQDVKVGDTLAPLEGVSPKVTSKFIFDGTKTRMVKIGDLHLSAEHYVGGVPAEEHPAAIAAESIPTLVCLNVEGHKFKLGSLVVSDYDESSDATVVKTTQALAELLLNGRPSTPPTSVVGLEEYSLGIEGEALILLENGEWKYLYEIKVGDSVQIGGRVVGVVEEFVETGVLLPSGVVVSASQLLWTGLRWERAAAVYPTHTLRKPLHQLFVENCTSFYVKKNEDVLLVREYREVADPEMEDSYREDISK